MNLRSSLVKEWEQALVVEVEPVRLLGGQGHFQHKIPSARHKWASFHPDPTHSLDRPR
jgi:hypothetical protein